MAESAISGGHRLIPAVPGSGGLECAGGRWRARRRGALVEADGPAANTHAEPQQQRQDACQHLAELAGFGV